MVGQLVGWSVGWLVGWLVGWSVGLITTIFANAQAGDVKGNVDRWVESSSPAGSYPIHWGCQFVAVAVVKAAVDGLLVILCSCCGSGGHAE